MCSDNKQLAVSFLVHCYFGDMEDPLLAAIDRAYLDMQAHTVGGNKADRFRGRKAITEILYAQIKQLPNDGCFDEWHKKLANCIHDTYPKEAGGKELSYGQIQKWINMTLKYCYVLRKLGIKSEGIGDYFDDDDNAEAFHAPLDSYVLKGIGEYKNCPSWSKIESYKTYDGIRKKIGFFEELEKWPEWAKEFKSKKADKGTYRRFIQDPESEE